MEEQTPTPETTPEQAQAIIAKAEQDRCAAFGRELEALLEKYQVILSPVCQIVGGQISQSLQVSPRK